MKRCLPLLFGSLTPRKILALTAFIGGRQVPTLQMAHNQLFQRIDMGRLGIQGRDIFIPLATGVQKVLPVLLPDLFQRFQTVGRESGADHLHRLDPLSRQRLQRLIGIGLEPLFAPKARLKAEQPLLRRQTEPLGQQAAGFMALAEVGVPLQQVAFGNTVERDQQAVGATMPLPVRPDRSRQGLDVTRIIMVVVDHSQLR